MIPFSCTLWQEMQNSVSLTHTFFFSFSISDADSCLRKEDKIVLNIRSSILFQNISFPHYVVIPTIPTFPPIMSFALSSSRQISKPLNSAIGELLSSPPMTAEDGARVATPQRVLAAHRVSLMEMLLRCERRLILSALPTAVICFRWHAARQRSRTRSLTLPPPGPAPPPPPPR